MNVFGEYARYYDLLYRDKEYDKEAEYINSLIEEHKEGASSLLDLGCGTCRHDALFLRQGYRVCGVDVSEEMLQRARAMAKTLQAKQQERLSLVQGDVRSIRLGEQFDVATSLFHVASYQTKNSDLSRYFLTAKTHIKKGGIFIFDSWYGPAVLTDRPTRREKNLEDDHICVNRIAEPVLHLTKNCVDVNYHVRIKNLKDGKEQELREKHTMRYLFLPEIEQMLETAGMTLLTCHEWMTHKSPDDRSWYVCCVARV